MTFFARFLKSCEYKKEHVRDALFCVTVFSQFHYIDFFYFFNKLHKIAVYYISRISNISKVNSITPGINSIYSGIILPF